MPIMKIFNLKYRILCTVCLLFLASWSSTLSAQTAVCNTTLNMTVGTFDGIATLTTDMIDAGSTDYESLSLDVYELDCDDIGINEITLTATASNGNTATCISTILLEDKTPPVPIVNSSVTVVFAPGQSSVQIFAEDIDEGSYDNCGAITMEVFPNVITCDLSDDVFLTFTATDQYGNYNQAFVSLIISGGNGVLACDNLVEVDVTFGPKEVLISDVLESPSSACETGLELSLLEGGSTRPNNIVDAGDVGAMIEAMVTSTATGNSCWGNISVVTNSCTDPAVFCDTECRDTPLGDCASGHTDSDNIEWPCDFEVPGFYDCVTGLSTLPQSLVDEFGFDLEDITPEITNVTCQLISVSYEDQLFYLEDTIKVLREWSAVSWLDNVTASYTQEILLLGGAATNAFFCDTEPWNTPFTGCAGGHSSQDAVEWPASIDVNTFLITPAQLKQNPDVHLNDAEPQLVDNTCTYAIAAYSDVVLPANQLGIVKVLRTWQAIEWFSGSVATYVQTISITPVPYDGDVCAYLPNGEVFSGVDLSTGDVTGDMGCVEVDDPVGTTVTASKFGDPSEGIDIDDYITVREHILGINEITDPYKLLAADVNGNGRVTSLDVVLIERMLLGLHDDPQPFIFVDGAYNAVANGFDNIPTFINLGSGVGQGDFFIGIKKGDVNCSYDPDGTNRIVAMEEYLTVDDKVLTQGERYFTSFEMKENRNVIGFKVEIPKTDNLDIEYIFSRTISDFALVNHVVEHDDMWVINYYPTDEEKIKNGTELLVGQELFSIKFKSQVNSVLKNELSFNEDNNILRIVDRNETFNLELEWNGSIVLNNNDLELEELKVYPNPAMNFVKVEYKSEGNTSMQYSIYDITGRLMTSNTLAQDGLIDVSNLRSGNYILNFITNEGHIMNEKLIIR